jgi:hypothetical protein
MPMSEHVYSYANGMDLRDEVITGEEAGTFSVVHVDPEKFSMDSSDPATAELIANVHEAVESTIVRHINVDGHELDVEYTTLNGDVNTNKVMVMFEGWTGAMRNPVGEREYAAIAGAFPDTHVIAINFFGSDGSSNLPKDVAKRLAATGSFTEVGRLLAPVIEDIFDQYEHRTLAGASLGARVAIGVASQLEHGVDVLRVIEPVGTREMGRLGIFKAFMQKEAGHATQVMANSPDPEGREIQAHNDSLGRLLRYSIKNILRRGLTTMMYRLPRSMSHNRLEADLMEVDGKVSEELTIISAENSEMNDVPKVRRILGRFAARNAGAAPQTIRHRVMEGRTHSYLNGVPQAQAQALSA